MDPKDELLSFSDKHVSMRYPLFKILVVTFKSDHMTNDQRLIMKSFHELNFFQRHSACYFSHVLSNSLCFFPLISNSEQNQMVDFLPFAYIRDCVTNGDIISCIYLKKKCFC